MVQIGVAWAELQAVSREPWFWLVMFIALLLLGLWIAVFVKDKWERLRLPVPKLPRLKWALRNPVYLPIVQVPGEILLANGVPAPNRWTTQHLDQYPITRIPVGLNKAQYTFTDRPCLPTFSLDLELDSSVAYISHFTVKALERHLDPWLQPLDEHPTMVQLKIGAPPAQEVLPGVSFAALQTGVIEDTTLRYPINVQPDMGHLVIRLLITMGSGAVVESPPFYLPISF